VINNRDSVELGIRGALIAKSALELVNCCDSAVIARAHFIEVVKQLKELDNLIARLEKESSK